MKYPIKAEILLTRRCNVRCPHCSIVRSGVSERPPDYWQSTLYALNVELGVEFFPIYGGEPLMYGRLPELISRLSAVGLPFSIISNSMMLTREMAIDFRSRGLKSYTASVDTMDSTKFSSLVLQRRNEAALRALDLFSGLALPDLQAQATISPFNIGEIVDLADHFTSRDIWFSFDMLHTSKSEGMDAASKVPPGKDLIEDHTPLLSCHMEDLICMLDGLIALKQQGRKIYQTIQYMESLKNPVYTLKRPWKCADHGYPGFLTIDADGSMMVCDDLSSPLVSRYKADILPYYWDSFVDDWYTAAKQCRGCIWSTHVSSYDHISAHVQHKEIQR